MKLGIATLIVVHLAGWTCLANGQNATTAEAPRQCTPFRGLTNPMTVPDLPEVCSDIRDSPQCCARDYILERLNITEEEFIESLRAELQDRFQMFRGIVMRVRTFLNSDFLDDLLASFADLSYLRVRRSAIIREVADELREHFSIDRVRDAADGFNVTGLLRRLINRVKVELVQDFASQSIDSLQQCIRDFLQGKVDEARLEAYADAVEQIRRVQTSLDKLYEFMENLNGTLFGFRPLQQCVNRLVEVNDCDSCLTPRPPLCLNWCGALARACYSPFYQVLNMQFERFWNISREILDQIPQLFGRLNRNRGVIRLASTNFVSEVLSQCSIDLSDFFPGKRQANRGPDFTPMLRPSPSFDASSLRGGAFAYNRFNGPRLCGRRFAIRRQSCWDGAEEREMDIPSFEMDTISGQDDNPAIQIDSSLLQAQANVLGSPVDTFLESETFTETMPDGLTGTDSGTGGSLGLSVTFTLLAAGLLAALRAN